MDIDNKSTEEYSNVNGQSGNILDPGRSSQGDESRTNNRLQNVQVGEVACDKVRKSLEDKSREVYRIIKDERK